MYTSMCIKDVKQFKKGEFFDTYQKRADPYVYIRPEFSEEKYNKIHKADYFSSFKHVFDSLSFDAKIYTPSRKVFGIFPIQEGADRIHKYYKFDFLNHKNLRELQSKILIHLQDFDKYVVRRLDYEEVKGILDRLHMIISSPEATEEQISECIEDFVPFLTMSIAGAKKGPHWRKPQ